MLERKKENEKYHHLSDDFLQVCIKKKNIYCKEKMMQIVRIISIQLFYIIIVQIRHINTCNVCKGFNKVDIFISTDIKQES